MAFNICAVCGKRNKDKKVRVLNNIYLCKKHYEEREK